MNKEKPFIQDLYPELNEAELKEAEKNLKRYADLVLRMYNRISSDPSALQEMEKLTQSNTLDTLLEDPA